VRTPTSDTLGYVDELRTVCDRTDGVTMIERYVSDAEFDEWITAADIVLLPYRRAWSSGALARAQRLGTSAFVADVGGLAEQAGPNDVVFDSEDALARLLARPIAPAATP
jgi:glycosyltransferase involved in cell wall biosynthesis